MTVGEIVATDFRAAAIFERYGLDFCCRGNRTLEQSCRDAGVRADDVLEQLEAIDSSPSNDTPALVPHIVRLASAAAAGMPIEPAPFGTVANPIHMMEAEHESTGHAMFEIRELTGGYEVPSDGCATYAVCLRELDPFERDLHTHVHLENNILFPKASAVERAS
jgi:regulator of cell morphogenesis and NO signaling